MGKTFLHGRANEQLDINTYAKLIVKCPEDSVVLVKSNDGSTAIKLVANSDDKAVLDTITDGLWIVGLDNIQYPPCKLVRIEKPEYILGSNTATINVTYPNGAKCTCSNGSIMYEAPDTTGNWSFVIPVSGVWNVTISDGVHEPVTSTVMIDSNTQTEFLTLDFVDLESFEATINVTYPEGAKCTCSNGAETYEASDITGNCSFIVSAIGAYTVTISDDIHESVTSTVFITDEAQVENVTLKFFEATINVTYPNGAKCTCSNGSIMYEAPDTTGNWSFVIPVSGVWNVTISDGVHEPVTSTVFITDDAQVENVTLEFFEATINITYPEGAKCVYTNGSTVYEAPDTTGSWSITVLKIGTYTVTISDGVHEPVTRTITLNSNNKIENVTLEFFEATINATYPDGAKCVCTNGSIVYEAPDTTGSWSITVPVSGVWNVIATTPHNITTSTTIVVDSDNRNEQVILEIPHESLYIYYPPNTSVTVTDSNGYILGEDINSSTTVKISTINVYEPDTYDVITYYTDSGEIYKEYQFTISEINDGELNDIFMGTGDEPEFTCTPSNACELDYTINTNGLTWLFWIWHSCTLSFSSLNGAANGIDLVIGNAAEPTPPAQWDRLISNVSITTNRNYSITVSEDERQITAFGHTVNTIDAGFVVIYPAGKGVVE